MLTQYLQPTTHVLTIPSDWGPMRTWHDLNWQRNSKGYPSLLGVIHSIHFSLSNLTWENTVCTQLLLGSCQIITVIFWVRNPDICPTSFRNWQIVLFPEVVSTKIRPAEALTTARNDARIRLWAWWIDLLRFGGLWAGLWLSKIQSTLCLDYWLGVLPQDLRFWTC